MPNPKICKVSYANNRYYIEFKKNSETLTWVHDILGPKMKNIGNKNLPVVFFSSRKEAKLEIEEKIIPFLLYKKEIELEQISGYNIDVTFLL